MQDVNVQLDTVARSRQSDASDRYDSMKLACEQAGVSISNIMDTMDRDGNDTITRQQFAAALEANLRGGVGNSPRQFATPAVTAPAPAALTSSRTAPALHMASPCVCQCGNGPQAPVFPAACLAASPARTAASHPAPCLSSVAAIPPAVTITPIASTAPSRLSEAIYGTALPMVDAVPTHPPSQGTSVAVVCGSSTPSQPLVPIVVGAARQISTAAPASMPASAFASPPMPARPWVSMPPANQMPKDTVRL